MFPSNVANQGTPLLKITATLLTMIHYSFATISKYGLRGSQKLHRDKAFSMELVLKLTANAEALTC
jgi:hypothetical protein